MKSLLPLVILLATGCNSEPDQRTAAPAAPAADALVPEDNRKSTAPALVPKPEDQAELDRLILAGYTPHADHLHPPGVKSCPLAQGGESVM